MPQPTDTEGKPSSTAREVVLVILSLVCLMGAMAAYWFYPSTSGNRPDLLGFIELFLREALLLTIFGIFMLVLFVVAILNALRRLLRKARSQSNRPT